MPRTRAVSTPVIAWAMGDAAAAVPPEAGARVSRDLVPHAALLVSIRASPTASSVEETGIVDRQEGSSKHVLPGTGLLVPGCLSSLEKSLPGPDSMALEDFLKTILVFPGGIA